MRIVRIDTGFSFCSEIQNGKHLVNILQIFLFSAISGLLPGRCRRSCFLRSRSPDRGTDTLQDGVTTIHLQTYTRMIHPIPFWRDQKTSCIIGRSMTPIPPTMLLQAVYCLNFSLRRSVSYSLAIYIFYPLSPVTHLPGADREGERLYYCEKCVTNRPSPVARLPGRDREGESIHERENMPEITIFSGLM